MEYIENMEFWHWFVIAIIFVIFEVFTMSLFVIWLAAAAAIVGLLSFFMPNIGWEIEWIIWAILSLLSIIGWHHYRKANPPPQSDQPSLNKRGSQYIDRVFTLEEAIVNGTGKINVDDSTWKVESEQDYPEGTKVKVTALDGVVLKVEKES